ncbi:S-type pyocin family protein [Brevundimonas sp.]|uniref:S-type pyocin family protein n=1 Tax=Brevundimonas sp. TaxID=1871086 RepID=UPI0028977BA6|nr:S-type pyocin family protein [Brevundimonas sp.]
MRFQMIAGVCAALALAGCDSGGSAVETRDRSAAEPVTLISAAAPDAEAEAAPEARPSVTANRRETADAKIQRLYERNGAAFGAKSADDYLRKVLAFTEATPKGTETVKRPNGDTLYYQASTNTFAVVDREGVPRTMFKPDDGPAYWAQQKERAPTFGQRRSGARAEE